VERSRRPIAVLLVDDHQLLVDALSRLLGAEPDIKIAGIAGSLADVRALAFARLDVALMDYRLPDGTGAEGARIVKSRWPACRVVMLTAVSDDGTVLESIQAGAEGYLTKDKAIDEVVQAVRAAHAGEILLPRAVVFGIAQRVAAAREGGPAMPLVETLTPRESEVLRALVDGLPSKTICERLFISPNTLRTHTQNIMGKLRVHSKLEAVAFALRTGLVEPPRSQTLLGG
jgi:two-component system response regulator DevR